jgi:hypothetical protein
MLCFTALSAGAAAPANNFPGGASNVDNQSHAIVANSDLWYSFQYSGDRSTVTLTMPNANGSGVGFNVFTPSQITDWWDEGPIGRGTAQAINCDTGVPEDNGACQSADLTWVGDFNEAGTYYVEVINNNSNATSFQLSIQGAGVSSVPPPAAPAALAPAAAPAQPGVGGNSIAPAAVAAINNDPGHAAAVANATETFGANSSQWYSFDYSGDRSEISIILNNGNASGLHFNVYTPAQIGDWWNEPPIGRGTGQALNCDTGVPEVNGACQSDDLTWVGNFNEAGTYYVQVVNGNPDPISAPLSLQVTASAQ